MSTSDEKLAATFADRRVLVTGGLGFVGSNVVQRLARLGAKVTAFDCLLPGSGANRYNVEGAGPNVTTVVGDLQDIQAIKRAIAGVDYAFNLAGQISHLRSMKEPYLDHGSNCVGHLNFVEAWRHEAPAAKVVYTATRQQYGRPQYLPMDEKHPLVSTDVNAVHKTAAESYHLLYARVYGLAAVSLRLTNTYGPRMLIRTPDQTFVGWFIHQAMTDHPIEVFGDGNQRRDLTYIDDAVDAILTAAARPEANGEIFNLGGPKPVSLWEVAEATVRIAGRGSCRRVPFPPERKAIDLGDAISDGSKIERVLGWKPVTSLEVGLEQSVAFYRSNWSHYT
jgi:UDP-glucose 4-epimerase